MTCKALEGGGTLQEVDAVALGQHLSFVTTSPFFFTRGEELPSVHQWASSYGQAEAMDGLITLHSSLLFLEIIRRNCYLDDSEDGHMLVAAIPPSVHGLPR